MAVPIRVLIVEDSEPDARLMMRELRKADLEPSYVRVETPEAMRSALQQGDWDLIIADYTMPHFSGSDALRLLNKTRRDIPFILVSGTVPQDVAIEMMKIGAQDFIMKRELARLAPAVARELRTSQILRERRHAEEALEEEQQHRLEFYRRTIQAATDGKLMICDRQDIKRFAGQEIESWTISKPEALGVIRHGVATAAESAGMSEDRAARFTVCIGEAATNALKHAGMGTVSLHRTDNALICVVEDTGSGIQTMSIPDVALTRGYSTTGTLGMGYKIMISLADRIYLETGPEGVTVAIEMMLEPARERTLLSADNYV
jgi:anti-sigma regulatory factor (Ser/Thr protein kinase)/DNA-binding response OmpR family regulator